MANYTVATGSDHNVLNWERRVEREILKKSTFSAFMSSKPDAGIRVIDELSKGDGAGDTVYTTLITALSGAGVSGDDLLEGQEEDMSQYRMALKIDQLRHAVKSAGKMTNQRTFIKFREEAGAVISNWHADRMDTWAANVLTGNTGQSNVKYTGMQATSAPTSAAGNMRILYGSGAVGDTTEASLSVTNLAAFRLTMLDEAQVIAETATPYISPISTPNGRKYIAVLHPHQVIALKTDATAARVTWYNYSKALLEGGGKNNFVGNPYRGAVGEYGDIIIHSNSRMPLAPGTTRVRRGVFFGANAAVMAFGKEGGTQSRYRMIEQESDFKNKLGIGAQLIGGMKKTVWNSIDHATIVLSSYATGAPLS